jgi:hypothetical protein
MSRPIAKVSPVSQIGPTMLAVIRRLEGRTASKSCHEPYSAGRARSFIAASTMTNGSLSPRLTRITRVSSTPALPAITRPGSNISVAFQPRVTRATIAPYSAGLGITSLALPGTPSPPPRSTWVTVWPVVRRLLSKAPSSQ